MRQIKFRIWNKTGKRMLYDSSLAFKGNAVVEEEGTKVMQFTGLKDKNGKEIYEGDIVRDKWEEIKEEQYIDYVIKWDSEKAMFNADNTDKFAHGLEMDELTDVEVIGNIYENPELLR